MKKLRQFLDRFGLDRCSAKSVMFICFFAGIIIEVLFIGIFSWSEAMITLGFVLGLAVVLIGVAVYSAFAPCPHCGKYVDFRHADAFHCPDCGGELD